MSLLKSVYESVFGSANKQTIKQYEKIVAKINELEPSFQSLSDADLQQKTSLFKDRLSKGESLDDILPEAFATVREAAKRVSQMRHFDVQLIGGMALHNGMIAEMRTGEGKPSLQHCLPTSMPLKAKGYMS